MSKKNGQNGKALLSAGTGGLDDLWVGILIRKAMMIIIDQSKTSIYPNQATVS